MEGEDIMNDVSDIDIESTSSESFWNVQDGQSHHGFSDPLVNISFADLRTIDENSFFAKTDVSNCGSCSEDVNDRFTSVQLPPLKASLLPRSSSAESASTTTTSASVMCTNNYPQQHYLQSQQQSPQRNDSSSISMVSIEDQASQPHNYTRSFVQPITTSNISVASSDVGVSGTITPTQFDTEITPTPINPYKNLEKNQRKSENNVVFGDKKESNEEDHPASVDELMAKELNKLSFKQRETINEEIHGIGVPNAGVKESPELLSESFQQLDLELQNLRPKYPAFDRSQQLFGATTYLNTEDLRIKFLRCDLFNIERAAQRLCEFAEVMLECYGDVALQRRPYITDLTELEVRVLEAGGYQVLPGRDRAGRRILANLAFDAPKEFDVLQRLRVGIYVVLAILDDVETQQKGAVGMSWWHNVSVDDFIIRKKVHEKVNHLPLRLGGFHCCMPSEVPSNGIGKKGKNTVEGISSGMTQFVKAMTAMSLGPKLRPHVRFHTGSVVECIYALQSFGIHSDQMPINSSSGKLKMKQHLKWLELRRLKEESWKQQVHKFDRIIECPKQTDVLFGRGRPIMRHPGNAVLRNVVQQKLQEYASAKSKKETTDVTWEVVRTLKGKYGARFLREENIESSGLGWIEVSNETARQKVRIAFRDLRTKLMRTNAAETNDRVKTVGESGKILNSKRKGETGSPITTPSVVPSSRNTTFENPYAQNFQETKSSTSLFLGMDGIDVKRQRLCF